VILTPIVTITATLNLFSLRRQKKLDRKVNRSERIEKRAKTRLPV